jgi:sarcosine oxidase
VPVAGAGRARVAVIGAGITGAAAAYALARRGLDVVLVDRLTPGHARGGSHGATRIFRLSYAEPEFVRLAQEALAGWRRLEQESDDELLSFSGLLEVARDVTPYARALDACGVAWEELDAATVSERFGIRLPAAATALLQHEAGVVHADRALTAFLAVGRARGVRLLARTPVAGVDVHGAEARLRTPGEDLRADAVVVAAGAWAASVLAPLGIELDLTPTRETVVYLRTDRALPSLIDEVDPPRGEIAYALPDPTYGLKAGFHRSGPTTDPDDAADPDPELAALTVAWARERLPVLGDDAAALDTCLYANLPGSRFAIERHGRVVVASACSGHGFKFAPAVGERVAALVTEALG